MELFAILSPIATGIITGIVAHHLTNKSKKKDILYQYKIPAFTELNKTLTNFKKHVLGLIAEEQGNEYSPYYYEGEGSTLEFRIIISDIKDLHNIFLSKDSREAIDNLLQKMSFMCGLEASKTIGQLDKDVKYANNYLQVVEEINKAIEVLYKDLNLK